MPDSTGVILPQARDNNFWAAETGGNFALRTTVGLEHDSTGVMLPQVRDNNFWVAETGRNFALRMTVRLEHMI
ncbi:hypothetical protein TNIN_343011 [Trichonephila inaurata madagascariensis]|uniref:Uncharacterized protein n=1 Tax=Trichonephila inaurata madagascariensis TaxID=2747483 RepID=A0A8X6XK43_9ARAC|nr:hypothetical protein TNIN_343011 [Trichonephila inaurata madagascariensis]